MSKQINIGGRIHSTEVGNVVAGANEILDDTKGKKQNVINSETDAELLRLDQSKQNNLTFDNTPTENSNNPVKSSGVYAADKALSDAIEAILLLIPSAATALNQLADKAFVNSSVSTATATFRGTYNVVTDLELAYDATHEQIATKLGQVIATADNNDYVFVQVPVSETSTDIRRTERYKFNGTVWGYEYDLNTSGFTQAQWEAINSAITAALVQKLSALPTAQELAAALLGKQDVLTFDNAPTSGSSNPVKSGGVYTAINDEKVARENADTGLGNRITTIENVIPNAASSSNKLVDNSAMADAIGVVTALISQMDATFNLTTTDGHITLHVTQADGVITSVQVQSSDIASAAALTLITNRVTTAEGDITSLAGRMTTAEGDIETLQDLYNALQQSAPQVIKPTDPWPVANPSNTVIYRVIDRVNTPPEYYSDYMWNGTSMVLMATYNNAIDTTPKKDSPNLVTSGGVFANIGAFDVSEYHKSGGTLATYADLSAALAVIPTDYQKGGMSIKFVQSSDNKYVQYRYMPDDAATIATFTDITNWQVENLSLSQDSIFSNIINFDILDKHNFIIAANGEVSRSVSNKSVIIKVTPNIVHKIISVTPNTNGTNLSFLKNVDFLVDTSITSAVFSDIYNSRITVTSVSSFTIPEDCRYIVFQTKIQDVDFTPTASITSGISNIDETVRNISSTCKSQDILNLNSISSSGTRPLEYKFKQGNLYSFKNNCSVAISLATCTLSAQRIELLFSEIPAGAKVYKYASNNADYFNLYSGTSITGENIDFTIVDESAEITEITSELQPIAESRVDNLPYISVNFIINNSDKWQSNSSVTTRLYAVKPGATYRILTNGNYANTKRFAFLVDNTGISSSQVAHFAGNVPHVVVRTQNEVEIIAPDNAMWLAILWGSSTETYAPLIYEINGGEFAPKSEIENKKVVTNIDFLNASTYGEEIEFVVRRSNTTDKAINVSKDIYYCPYGGITYNVSQDYKIAILPYGDDFKAPTAILNNTWYTGDGSLSLPTPYFRIYIKSTTDDTIITPESGYTVSIGNAVVNYGQNKDYYLIAAQDSEEQYKKIADFVAGEDARPALQVAADEAYIHGTILKMAPGTYVINSSLNNEGLDGLSFSQFVSPHQYDNPYQGVTIEGLRKPNGYVGDAAIIKMSDSLYGSIDSTFRLIRVDPAVSQDWHTFFVTTALNIKNVIIQIPDNQKPIHAIDLQSAEGGSRLEGLRIVGIPIIDENYYPEHANEGSVGIVSNPGSTWNTNSYWNDIEIHGFYYGVYFAGMEHAFVHNLTVQWCEYGLKFQGGGQHPIQLIAVQDEHNVNLPDFGDVGRAIELSGYNASWPEAAPGFPDAQTEGWNDRKRAQGNPIGSVEFTNNITSAGSISTPRDYPTYFEHGQGHRMKVRNMNHQLSGTTTYRRSIAPNYMQQIYDTTLNKMVWCIDTENKTWVDADGTDVDA